MSNGTLAEPVPERQRQRAWCASAALPGQFPPVLIDVEAGGRNYQEMRVDGGAMAQVFVYPVGLDFDALSREHDASGQRTLYVIRNPRLDPEWAQIERRTFSIAFRAISSIVQGAARLRQGAVHQRQSAVGRPHAEPLDELTRCRRDDALPGAFAAC